MGTETKAQKKRTRAPARTAKARESYMVNLAMDAAEEQLLSGKASSQLITHFLRLGTARAQYELAKLEADTKLSIAKAEGMEIQKRSEELTKAALEAFKSYVGIEDDYNDYNEDEEDYD